MGQPTDRDMTFMLIVIALGLVFFAAVCITIYYFFKRLARQDKAENERFNEEQNDAQTEPQSDILKP